MGWAEEATRMNLALRAKLPWAEGGRRLDYEAPP